MTKCVIEKKHPDWQCMAKPTDPHAGTVVPRCGVQERREASPRQTQKLKRMSIPPALPKPQLLSCGASDLLAPPSLAARKTAKTTKRPSFHLQILYTVCGSLLFFAVFGEDEANRQNRLIIRNGIPGAGIALNRPLPWDDPGYDLKQPTGDQVLKPLKIRPLVKARAMQRPKNAGSGFAQNRPMNRKSWGISSSNSESKTTSNSNTMTPSNSKNHE